MTVDDLAHDIRNGLLGVKDAVKRCKEHHCPLGMRNLEILQEVSHHCARIERALKVYVAHCGNTEN
jgi:hypothetical protein